MSLQWKIASAKKVKALKKAVETIDKARAKLPPYACTGKLYLIAGDLDRTIREIETAMKEDTTYLV